MRQKKCFFICEFGKERTPTRKKADRILLDFIKPVLSELKYIVHRGDVPDSNKPIPDAISDHLFHDDLVIADISTCNPNVFFELGNRHAWGKRCLLITQNIKKLPFNVNHLRVIEYSLTKTEFEKSKIKLRTAVQAAEKAPAELPKSLDLEIMSNWINDKVGNTFIVDRKRGHLEHYQLATELAKEECKRIFLMQRSSTLIFGSDANNKDEKPFYNTLLEKIQQGVEFYHIVSLEGIKRYLQQVTDHKEILKSLKKLSADDRKNVVIKGKDRISVFKIMRDQSKKNALSPDRQARAFIVELTNGVTEGVLVVDIGGLQSSFRIRGPIVQEFLKDCLEFYKSGCKNLSWKTLNSVLNIPPK